MYNHNALINTKNFPKAAHYSCCNTVSVLDHKICIRDTQQNCNYINNVMDGVCVQYTCIQIQYTKHSQVLMAQYTT